MLVSIGVSFLFVKQDEEGKSDRAGDRQTQKSGKSPQLH